MTLSSLKLQIKHRDQIFKAEMSTYQIIMYPDWTNKKIQYRERNPIEVELQVLQRLEKWTRIDTNLRAVIKMIMKLMSRVII
jgi:hypothetical protein